MKNLEEILCDGLKYILCKMIKPNMEVNSVIDLTKSEIDKLVDYYGIKGVILDIDDTIRFDMNDIPEENDIWLDMITSKIRVIVVSNGIDRKIEAKMKEKGIGYIGYAHKPLKYNFLKACNMLQLSTKQVVVIGDDIISDIYGGNRNNMFTIKVNKDKKIKQYKK